MDVGDVISDEELSEIALAADPNTVVDDDAVPFVSGPTPGAELLPQWYMPVPRHVERTPSRVFAAVAFIVALVVVNGAGLCVTYGLPEIAW